MKMIEYLLNKNRLVAFLVLCSVVVFAQNEIKLLPLQESPYDQFYKGAIAKNGGSYLSAKSANKNKFDNANQLMRTVTTVDLNGPISGTTFENRAAANNTPYRISSGAVSVVTSTGTATSARISFSTSTAGAPLAVPGGANELFQLVNSGGTQVVLWTINTANPTAQTVLYGGTTFRISHANAFEFVITNNAGGTFPTADLQLLLFNAFRYAHSSVAADSVRYMHLAVTDPQNTLSAYSKITTGSPPVAVDDTNNLMANAVVPVAGNVLTNDTDATVGDVRTLTRVHEYPNMVGNAYTTTYGSITMQANGSYNYTVDVNNSSVKGLRTGDVLQDIIAYRVDDNVGNLDYGYLTITINGVTELPVATNNTNNVTVNLAPTATGNVLFDDSGFGEDKMDRQFSQLVWEAQYAVDAPIHGTSRTINGVTASFVTNSAAYPFNQTVDQTAGGNGGHFGYVYFTTDGTALPTPDNKLTMNFNPPVTNLSFTLSDIDYSQSIVWQDQFRVTGTLGGNPVAFDRQVAGGILLNGPDTFYGTGSVITSDAHGNVRVLFPTPVDSVVLDYNYGPNVTAADPSGQVAGLTDLIWQDANAGGVRAVYGVNANVGVNIPTTYGFITLNTDGSYTYTVNPANPTVAALVTGQTLTDVIPYTISDNLAGAGNLANANLILTITGANVISAVDDAPVALAAGASTPSVIVNDTLDAAPALIGANPGEVTLTSLVVPAGLTLNPDGTISVAATTPSGTYLVDYQICENGAVPVNCDPATATVIVANALLASDDALPSVGGSVLGNDTLNGVSVTTANTDVTPATNGPLAIDADGNVTVAPNTPSGTYTIPYTICETGAVPANCQTATATVVINNPIDAIDDAAVTVASTNAIVTVPGNVTSNDTLNGVAVTAANTDVTPGTNGPLSVDANGVLTVAANTASGTYTITYQLCEVGAVPVNCDTATATVVVANPIDAVNDTPAAPVASTNVPVSAGSVLGNDTLSGIAVTPANTNVTPVTNGPLSVDANGGVTVAANTPSGVYTVTYQLCEADPVSGLNVVPANCDTAIATITVANPIDAINDPSVTLASGSTPVVVPGNVTTNDTLSGIAVTGANTNVTPVTNGPLSVDANGVVTLAANTVSGTYTVNYQLCEADPVSGLNVTPANCDLATATVVVANALVATNDTLPSTGGSVLGNDTLNGVPVTVANTDVTPATNGPLTIDADGNVTVAPNTPSGTYTIPYTICETGAVPANCQTATATVVINNPIDAIDDAAVTVASTSAIVTVPGNVTSNDTLNGVAVTAANTDVTPGTNGPLSVDANGVLTVAANTPSGTYTINYQLCEVSAVPANCDTALATVIVANPIVATDDTPAPVASANAPVSAGSVLGNDTLSGITATTTNTNVTPVVNGPLSVDANGDVTVAANTPSGVYTVTYQLCEADPVSGLNVAPANCATAIATITVSNPIDAIDDAAVTLASGTAPVVVPGNVTTNDTLSGVAVTGVNTNVTPVVNGPLSVDADGVITLASNTVSGTYTVNYQLCEVDPVSGLNVTPANCDLATATVVVANALVATNDTLPSTGGSVLGNDTLNGVPVTIANTDVTPGTNGPLTIDADGNVTVASNTPSGTYTITYTICETGANPANCQTATATVVVTALIDAVNDPAVTVTTGATATVVPGSVIGNDTLNGVPVTTANTDVTPVVSGPLSVDVDGVITVAANTPSGTYTVTYQLCETGASPANCDTATATVVVNNVIDAVNDPAVTVTTGATATVVPGSVIGNDTLNGVPVTTANTDVTPVVSGPLSVDVDGVITVAANTPSGTYTVTYQLCETGASPANCDTATATVVVNNVIDAVNDPAVTVTTGATATVVPGSVIGNDTLNGVPVTTANTDVTPVVSGPLSVDVDGVITVAANTPSGTYTVTYQLCETGASPTNCDTATATVVVNNVIDAVNDPAVTVTTGATATVVPGSVIGNDTLNGVPVTTANTDVTPVVSGPLSVDVDGVITVAANTPSGTYTVTYQLCETGASPANCDTATATVVVNNVIDAVNDPAVTVTTGATATVVPGSVIGNDTLNGVPVTTANTDVTPVVSGPLSVDVDGVITVAANTPSGTYTVTYQLCETGASPANCDTATATVVVNNVIDAVNDPAVTVTTGATATVVPGSVIGNDTLNGVPVTTANTDVTPVVSGPLSVDVDGVITVAANTPSGTYTVTYQLCETGASPANCDTATATVVVNNVIDAVNDPAVTVTTGATATVVPGSVIGNDTLNGVPVTTANTDVTPVVSGPLSVDVDGVITVAANTPSGTYTVTYQLCETGASPTNCDTATATVVVNNVIDAVNDPAVTVTTGATATVVPGSVIGNDTLNGVPVTTANTDVTPVVSGPLSVDVDGVITVAANTPSGTYTVTYQLCETGASPANCDTATATVVVNNVIDAVNDPAVTVTTGATATVVPGSVIGNDTLNGVPVTTANTDVTPVVSGPLSVDVDGVITVAANTPSGTYTVTYQLCETGASPVNCDTATATVVVNNVIDAVNDPAVTVTTGATATVVPGSVIGNDTLNGVPVTTANTDVTPVVSGPLSVDVDGVITVAANTPSGTYTVTYQLCETGASPVNCDTATATVVVNNVIDAVNDPAVTVTTGATATVVPGSVIGNDTLNGVPVTTANTDVTPVVSGPLSVDVDGVITVAANTPSGTYTVTYQLCETGASPVNCDTATATVVVNNVIDAVNDPAVTVTTGATATVVPGSVIGNDTLNGVPVTTANTDVTPVVSGPLSVDVDGVITVAANTPSGTYTVTYQLCETGASPVNCDTATATVVVNNVIDAVNDPAVTVTTGATATVVPGSVIGNDTLNGVPVTTANTDVTPVVSGPLSVDVDGVITVAANTPSGTYTVTYQLCETGASPVNCDTATATVVVNNVIDAVNDPAVTVTTGATATVVPGSVIGNDTLNGVPVTTANTDVTPVVSGPLSVDVDGVITVAANTPSGTYTVTYQLCETGASPVNCDTATATVVVNNVIDAVNDPAVTVTTGATATVVPGSVIGNDTLNGVPVTTANTDVTPVVSGPLSVDVDGVITVAANTPSGTYTVTYQLCETGASPANCDTATATVVVNNVIDAVNDPAVTVTTGATATVVPGSVIGNDTLNGVPVTTANTDVTPVVSGPLSVDVDGVITVAANTPSGTYTVTYQLCETGASPVNCDTATATVVVNNVIDAVNDPAVTVTTGATATVVPGSVIGNDTLNGVPVTTANTDVTPVVSGPLSVDVDGVITVAANTPSGTYTVTYQLCETGASPVNCDTATATVVVNNVIDAVNDPAVTVTTGATATVVPGSVIGNDTLNGVPVTTANTDVTPVVSGPLSVDVDGVITVAANTPSGTYTVTYQLCETGASPVNCDTATATVVVNNVIDAVNDPAVTVTTGATATVVPGSVIGNDTLNGVPVTTANTDVTPVVSGPLSVDVDGVITVAANTPSGTYTVTYQLCETGASPVNCDTATATVVVNNVIDAVNDPAVTVTTGATATVVPGSVIGNDTLNGVPVTTANTDVTPVVSGPLSVDVDGVITVAANTPSGTYTVTYQLCETGASPANCDTATATVVVANPIVLDNDADQIVVGTTGTTNIFDDDTFNGKPLSIGNGPGQVTLSPVVIATPGITLNPNGTISVANTVPDGTYSFTYTICENGAVPQNCQSAIVTVVVIAKVEANDDDFGTVNGSTGASVGNVLVNDIINNDIKNPPTIATVTLDQLTFAQPVITAPANSPVPYLDEVTGNVIVPAGTPAGTYTFTYSACLVVNPSVCDTAIVKVTVNPAGGEELVVYNHVVPNSPENQLFFIDGIQKYPNNTVEIYNRWGVLVYEATGYNNNDKAFRGESNGRVTIQRDTQLPEGTYYYILRYVNSKNESKEKAGYLYINR
ncbi:gliding motility-associated C-terminal domain-containing protein [Flavobacterium sp.]|uniref:T9SS type B sorting domain-containing protein n=1 Tax=Flavobacterium sp. TaxID=239 RepID=UPI003D0D9FB7